MSFQNKSFSIDNWQDNTRSESAVLEGNIENCVKDGLKHPDSTVDVVNGNVGELFPQNKSSNIDSSQDNSGSKSAVLEGNIENCVKDDLKHPNSVVHVVNGNVGELFPQNKSSNIDSSQDNSGSKSAVLEYFYGYMLEFAAIVSSILCLDAISVRVFFHSFLVIWLGMR
ncbi:unnamed protein product [Cuscuta campestris]|uniref:Uncharacterized protein n=1 Tax=Cuscuta campestris TaxID=132261 RepID=A0A484NBX4_9ASTE|nr:unnamed protein product [Cuscuta campestris]